MTKLYICNKVADECKNHCIHAEPHERQEHEGSYCTKWMQCLFNEKYIKVRCVKVKETE